MAAAEIPFIAAAYSSEKVCLNGLYQLGNGWRRKSYQIYLKHEAGGSRLI